MESPPMILSNGQWVTPPPDAAPAPGPRPKKKRKKRRVTRAMRLANASNSVKSTGPSSASGRRAACMNAVRHGMACKELVFLDDEDENLFWADVDCRARELGVVTTEERALVVNAVYA